MFRLFDLFRRATRPTPRRRRTAGPCLGLESLEGRAVPASLAVLGHAPAADYADAARVTLSDVLVSSYETKGAASRVSTNDFHFVHRADKPSPALSSSAEPEVATSTASLGSQSTGAGAGKVTFNPF
jgi:hypothetical protein